MTFKFSSLHILILLLLFCRAGVSQENLPVADWVKSLSVKNDPRFEKLYTVYDQLMRMDSSRLAEAIAILEKLVPTENDRYYIRFYLLKSRIIMAEGSEVNTSWPMIIDELKVGLKKSYELEDPFMIAEMHHALSMQYMVILELGTGLMHAVAAKEIQEENGIEHFRGVAYSRYCLGLLQYKAREYLAAIPTLYSAIGGFSIPEIKPGDTLNAKYQVLAWNALGLCYKNVDNFDSAFYSFTQGLEIAKRTHYTPYVGILEGNLGDIYYRREQFDSAKLYLQRDVETSMAEKEYRNAALSMQWLARISAREGNHTLAQTQIREAYRIALSKTFPFDPNLAEIYFGFAEVFEMAGAADSAMKYMKLYLVAHDMIESKNADLRTEIANVRIENEASVQKIMALNREKRRVVMIRNGIILLILLASSTGFLYLNRQRLHMRLLNLVSEEEKRKLLREAEIAREQLRVYTQHIVEKTTLVDNLQEQLTNKSLNETQIQYLNELSRHSILTDADWDEFKELFEKVYPAFFIDLRNTFPEITIAELRMAALVKLRITVKHAAALLGISPNSVHKTRQRLRYRLNLEPDADLEQYFASAE